MSDLFSTRDPSPHGYWEAGPQEVWPAKDEVRLVDVREAAELVGELGHIRGAEHVPQAQLGRAARDWDKDEAIVVVCRSGGRSGRAARLLVAAGFKRVVNMRGGMLKWNALGLAVERG